MNGKWLVKLRRWFLMTRYGFWVPPYDGMMNEARCRFLYDMAICYQGQKNDVVEIGVFKGSSTTWLAMGARRSGFRRLIAVDLFTGTPQWGESWDTYEEFMTRMRRNGLEKFIRVERGDSKEVSRRLGKDVRISILHIDGDHSYEGARADVDHYVSFLDEGGIIILDDHDPVHPGVIRVVEELKAEGFCEVARVLPVPEHGGGSIALKKVNVFSA